MESCYKNIFKNSYVWIVLNNFETKIEIAKKKWKKRKKNWKIHMESEKSMNLFKDVVSCSGFKNRFF